MVSVCLSMFMLDIERTICTKLMDVDGVCKPTFNFGGRHPVRNALNGPRQLLMTQKDVGQTHGFAPFGK